MNAETTETMFRRARAPRRGAFLNAGTGVLAAGALLILGGTVSGYLPGAEPVATTETAAAPLWAAVPVCAAEDGTGAPCYWHAGTAGNGHGTSFYVDADGATHYPGAVVTVDGRPYTVPGLPASS